jgi:uncharacterized protein GlcG (DUF336 family)
MLRLVSAAALLFAPQSATAQQVAVASGAPPSYGVPIGHDAAMKAIAAAEAEPKNNNWSMVIAVVDSRLVAFLRMDNAILGSIDIAMGKAITAKNLRRPTKDPQELVGQSGATSVCWRHPS